MEVTTYTQAQLKALAQTELKEVRKTHKSPKAKIQAWYVNVTNKGANLGVTVEISPNNVTTRTVAL